MDAEMEADTKVSLVCHPREQTVQSRTSWSKVLFVFQLLYIIFMFFSFKKYYKINSIPFLLAKKFLGTALKFV